MKNIVISSQEKKWDSLIRDVPGADIFFTRKFSDFSKALLFYYDDGNNRAIFPFVTSGSTMCSQRYGGIILKKKDGSFFKKAADELYSYCRNNDLNAIIIRKHPFAPVLTLGEPVKTEPFVYIELDKKIDEIRSYITKHHQKNINKACNNDLGIAESRSVTELTTFYSFYSGKMKEKNIKDHGFEYFQRLSSCLKDKLRYISVKSKNEVIAVSLVLESDLNAYMLYGSMSDEGYKKLAKYYMIFNLISKYKAKGFRRLVLGTGNAGNDPIYNFKRGFQDKDHYIDTYEKKIA